MINHLMLTNSLLKEFFDVKTENIFIPEFIDKGIETIIFYGIESNTFFDYINIKSIYFPFTLNFFQYNSISNLPNLKEIYINSSKPHFQYYQDNIFTNCPKLKNIYINNKKLIFKNNKCMLYNPNNVKI